MTPLIRIIQELVDTWSDVKQDVEGQYGVTLFFDCEEDAETFKVELMMAASGQTDYPKDGDSSSTPEKT